MTTNDWLSLGIVVFCLLLSAFFAVSARLVERRHWRMRGWTEDASRTKPHLRGARAGPRAPMLDH